MQLVLTVAGSDSIAGAGLQADLKTFAALGVYGATAATAITAQSTGEVSDICPVAAAVVRSQIDAVARDASISAVKTGMLATREIVLELADAITRHRLANVVVDPVLAATAGRRTLLEPDAVSVVRSRLFPLATVVTPNAEEASTLSGVAVTSLDGAREAATRIAGLGPAAVVVTGGHFGTDAVDVLFYAGTFHEFRAERAATGNVHGTGCTFSAAVAAGLALGDTVPEAVQRAKRYVTGAIKGAFQIGRGPLVLDHFWERLY